MKSFLFGLGLGIGMGVLFAPMSGEDARNTLQERANDIASTARDTYEQGRDKVQRGISSIRGEQRATGTEGSSNI
jgi:gas vesicle protein